MKQLDTRELKLIPTTELEAIISSESADVDAFMNEFSTTMCELKKGTRLQKETAASLTNVLKCILCSITNMSEVGDIDGVLAVRECAATESGCREVVTSN